MAGATTNPDDILGFNYHPHRLSYSIYSCSSCSSNYHPLNIFEDRPTDERSRWTCAGPMQHFAPAVHGRPAGSDTSDWTNETLSSRVGASLGSVNLAAAGARKKEYIMLDLGQPCIVRTVTFGKYSRAHPCNFREFKVWGSLAPGEGPGDFTSIEVAAGLHNESTGSLLPAGPQTLGATSKRIKPHGEKSKVGPKMELLLHGELKNDATAEVFRLRWRTDEGLVLPVRYIKIEPLYAAGSNYNQSIWHVALTGLDEPEILEPVMQAYEHWRDHQALKLTLKHLRQNGHLSAFSALLRSLSAPPPFPPFRPPSPTSIPPLPPFSFEHPLLSQLHTALVVTGDFSLAESLLSKAALETPLFSSYLSSQSPTLRCHRLQYPAIADADGNVPSGRGGHCMVLDSDRRKIWLYGGFDGTSELGDLWSFDLSVGRWTCVSRNAEQPEGGGPAGRSCHSVVLDPLTGDLYVLGRYAERADLRAKKERKALKMAAKAAGEVAARQAEAEGKGEEAVQQAREEAQKLAMAGDGEAKEPFSYRSDFWRYGQADGKWECLSPDTALEGGPQMIHDHQMVLDDDARRIYCFGGKRVLSDPGPQDEYSGMYVYDIPSRTWKSLLQDAGPGEAYQGKRLPSRIGHSVVLDKNRHCMWIFSGERGGQYFSDCWAYPLTGDSPKQVMEDYTAETNGPEAGFSQRTVFDADADEWHTFCGLCREQSGASKKESMTSEFWVFRVRERAWWKVPIPLVEDGMEAPNPRYAHQMVFDPVTKDHYVFGGNPAETDVEPVRLSDFWRLQLVRPTAEEALRKALFGVRRQQFIEMCNSADSMSALLFLQTQLAAVTDHTNEKEARTFRACMSHLLSAPNSRPVSPMPGSSRSASRLDDRDDASSGVDPMATSQIMSDVSAPGSGASKDPSFSSVEGPKTDRQTWQERTALFQELIKFFPATEREPDDELSNLVEVFGDREFVL